MPAAFVPFLGSALSRAREYTCDRYGCAAAGDREGALLGLAILSAGGKYGPLVNRAALVRQRGDLRGAWMLVGEWLGSHPPLARRLVALAPELEVRFTGIRRATSAAQGPPADAEQRVGRDLGRLKGFIEVERQQGKPLPWDTWELYARWEAAHPDQKGPLDPFSGYWYDYESHGDLYRLWSTGRDGDGDTADDIVLDSAAGASPRPRFVYKDKQ